MLVIIGLIIGGILVGQDLIKAAQVRAQISQIEKYNTAVNTFYGKYNALPGDISSTLVTKFGFTAVPTRAGTAGQGDGNGVIEGYGFAQNVFYNFVMAGETAWFWEDLSTNSGYIDQNFNTASNVAYPINMYNFTSPSISSIIPRAKMDGLYIYVYPVNGIDYFGLSSVNSLDENGAINIGSNNPGISVIAAYNIDKKMDDGLPLSGQVTVQYLALDIVYGLPFYAQGAGVDGPLNTSQIPPSATTCYDNSNTANGSAHYSVNENGGYGPNCALSFQMSTPGR